MFLVILLAALSILAIASTIAALHKDGYRRVPTDWSRIPESRIPDKSIHGTTRAGHALWQVDAGWGNRPASDRSVELSAHSASTR